MSGEERGKGRGHTSVLLSALSMPTKAWRNPTMITIRRAKKIRDSFIMTLRTTSMAPKKRTESKYSRRRIQNMGAEKAVSIQHWFC
jgi:hypothetical protein